MEVNVPLAKTQGPQPFFKKENKGEQASRAAQQQARLKKLDDPIRKERPSKAQHEKRKKSGTPLIGSKDH